MALRKPLVRAVTRLADLLTADTLQLPVKARLDGIGTVGSYVELENQGAGTARLNVHNGTTLVTGRYQFSYAGTFTAPTLSANTGTIQTVQATDVFASSSIGSPFFVYSGDQAQPVQIGTILPYLQTYGTDANQSALGAFRFGATAQGACLAFAKNRGAAAGSNVLPNASDALGAIDWYGNLGSSSYARSARIEAIADGAPSSTSMPTRLDVSVAPTGSTSAALALRLTSAGFLGVGGITPVCRFEASGTVRATGIGSASDPASGVGVEIGYRTDLALGLVLAYDRSAAAWKDLQVKGLAVQFHAAGSEVARVAAGELLVGTTSNTGQTNVKLRAASQVSANNYGTPVLAKGMVGASTTLDFSLSAYQTLTLTSATNCTIAFTAPANPCAVRVKVAAPAAGTSPTITWPASVKGAPPTSVTLARATTLAFFYDGANYIFETAQQNYT